MRKWKQTFWIQYGPTSLLFFRTFADYDDWLNNPYHTLKAREFLVKLRVDFVGDLKKASVMGYQVTQVRRKPYGRNTMLHFKLERWMDYGPTIAAAFAAREEEMMNSPTHRNRNRSGATAVVDNEDGFNTINDVASLRKIILGCMRNARDFALIASREQMAARPPPAGVGGNDMMMSGRYDGESVPQYDPPMRIPASTGNMGYHQAYSAEASERRRMDQGVSLDEYSESSRDHDKVQTRKDSPVALPTVDLLG